MIQDPEVLATASHVIFDVTEPATSPIGMQLFPDTFKDAKRAALQFVSTERLGVKEGHLYVIASRSGDNCLTFLAEPLSKPPLTAMFVG